MGGTVSLPIFDHSEIAWNGLPTLFQLPENRRDGLLVDFDQSEIGRDGLPTVLEVVEQSQGWSSNHF